MNKRKYFTWYIIISIIYICSILINLGLPTWFQYCYWNFGLISANSFTDIKDFSEENLIVATQGDACGSLKDLISNYCSDVCNNIDNFRIGGILLICFSLASCISTSLCIFFFFRVLNDETLYLKSLSLFMFFPFIFLVAGFSTYVGLCDFININSRGSFENISRKFSLKEGFYMAIWNFGLCFGILIYGSCKCRKLLKVKNS